MHFLLIHGAFQKANVWPDVIELLREKGHYCETVSLPGHDETADNTVSLRDYVEVIQKPLRKSNDKWRLVCHSFGGIHGAIAASQCINKIDRLVFVAANIALEGETAYSLLGDSFQAKLREAVKAIPSDVEFPGNAAEVLFNSQANANEMMEYLCLEPAQPYFDVVQYRTDWRSELKGRIDYICGVKDMVMVKNEKLAESKAAKYAKKAGVEAKCIKWIKGADHELMLSSPSELAQLLMA